MIKASSRLLFRRISLSENFVLFLSQYILNSFLLGSLLIFSGYLYFSYIREAQAHCILALCEGTNQLFGLDGVAQQHDQ